VRLQNPSVNRLDDSVRFEQTLAQPLAAAGLFTALLPLFGALAVWTASLQRVDTSTLSDLGLVSAMPYAAWLPHLLLSVGFFFVICRQPERSWLPYLYLASLVVVLHATPAIEYGTLRYPWAWKHLGIIDYIQRHGAVDRTTPILSAYHNWPGCFAAAAFISDLLGIRELATPVRWTPLVLNLLYLAALPQLYRSFTNDPRTIFGSVWIFLGGNWIGQDYFSPQGVNFFFYLVLLGLCLRFLGPQAVPASPGSGTLSRIATAFAGSLSRGIPPPSALATGMPRVIMTATALLLIVAMTVSHQLTPLVAISALGVLAALRRIAPGLFLFAGVAVSFWTLYVAAPFVAVVLPAEIREIGLTVGQLGGNLANISVVSPGQALIAVICRILTLGIAAAALTGGVRRLASGYRDGIAAGLAVAPLPLLAVTSYGGEIMFRVYLFALPFLAFFAASLFFPRPRRASSTGTLAVSMLFGFALAVAFVFANNGKDRQYAFASQEVAGVQWLYDNAPQGTLLVEGAPVYPSQARNVEYFTHVSIADEPADSRAKILSDPAAVLAGWLDSSEYHAAFVILTRSQEAYVDAMGLMPGGGFERIKLALLSSPRFRLVHASGGTMIFSLNEAVRGMGEWIN
jgi:hypothetical protein